MTNQGSSLRIKTGKIDFRDAVALRFAEILLDSSCHGDPLLAPTAEKQMAHAYRLADAFVLHSAQHCAHPAKASVGSCEPEPALAHQQVVPAPRW